MFTFLRRIFARPASTHHRISILATKFIARKFVLRVVYSTTGSPKEFWYIGDGTDGEWEWVGNTFAECEAFLAWADSLQGGAA